MNDVNSILEKIQQLHKQKQAQIQNSDFNFLPKAQVQGNQSQQQKEQEKDQKEKERQQQQQNEKQLLQLNQQQNQIQQVLKKNQGIQGGNSGANGGNQSGFGGGISGKKNEKKFKKDTTIMRQIAGELWEDETLADWPKDDYRVFVGNLGNEVTDNILKTSFERYASLNKVRVIRNKKSKKSEGYGFVSLLDPNDYLKCLKEMNGQYVGNRPCKILPSKWKDRMAKTEKYQSDQIHPEFRKSEKKEVNFQKKLASRQQQNQQQQQQQQQHQQQHFNPNQMYQNYRN